jgi:hypothetical protein
MPTKNKWYAKQLKRERAKFDRQKFSEIASMLLPKQKKRLPRGAICYRRALLLDRNGIIVGDYKHALLWEIFFSKLGPEVPLLLQNFKDGIATLVSQYAGALKPLQIRIVLCIFSAIPCNNDLSCKRFLTGCITVGFGIRHTFDVGLPVFIARRMHGARVVNAFLRLNNPLRCYLRVP